MIVSCTNCDSKYSVDDSKVIGKRFGFSCPKCKTNVEIDNREKEEETSLLEDDLGLADEVIEESQPGKGDESADMDIELPIDEDIAEDLSPGGEMMEGEITEDAEFSDIGAELPAEDEIEDIGMEMPSDDELEDIGTKMPAEDVIIDAEMNIPLEDEFSNIAAELPEEDEFADPTEKTLSDEPGVDLENHDIEITEEPDIASDSEAGLAGKIEAIENKFKEDVIPTGLDDNDEEEDASDKQKDELAAAMNDLGAELLKDDNIMEDETAEILKAPDLVDPGEILKAGEAAEDAISVGEDKLSEESEDLLPDILEEDKEDLDLIIDKEIGIELDDVETIETSEAEMETEKQLGTVDDISEDFTPIEEDIIPEAITMEEEKSDIELDIEKDADMEALEEEIDLSDTITIDDVKNDKLISPESVDNEDDDENITIDLDSLDIQLEDENGVIEEGLVSEEISDFMGIADADNIEITDIIEEAPQKKEAVVETMIKTDSVVEDDEDITLDLDSLDLTLDEVEELKESEAPNEDERITLSDAGLSPDELIEEDDIIEPKAGNDEDIRLSIDEVAPEVSIEKEIDKETDELNAIDQEETIKHIDFDNIEENNELDLGFVDEDAKIQIIDEFEETEENADIRSSKNFKDHEAEIASVDANIRDTVPGGMVNFSIDYSLKFSRIGAIFRLLALYPLVLLPHILVAALYFVLSIFLAYINWILIALTGEHEEDFTEIQIKTIRYLLSISACAADVVEEMPEFAGNKDIDYSLQYDATYPTRYSRILAILRLSVVGILIAALPHLILLLILTVGSVLIYFAGLIAIIIKKRWPNALFDFMVRYNRYTASVISYVFGVIDRYPSFKFD